MSLVEAGRKTVDAISTVRSLDDVRLLNEYRRLPSERKPNNIAIIMDANNRWARENGVSTEKGHEEGAKAAEKLVRYFSDEGMDVFLWGFSTDNWKRSEEERDWIFGIMDKTVKKLLPELMSKKGRFIWFGLEEPFYNHRTGDLLIPALPNYLIETFKNAQEKTKNNMGNILGIGANYSGEDEQRRANERIRFAEHTYGFDEPITRDVMQRFSDDGGAMGDFDLVIRPGGDPRLSGLGWRTDNAQIYLTPVKLPDLDEKEIMRSVVWFSQVEQRHGGRPKAPQTYFKNLEFNA